MLNKEGGRMKSSVLKILRKTSSVAPNMAYEDITICKSRHIVHMNLISGGRKQF